MRLPTKDPSATPLRAALVLAVLVLGCSDDPAEPPMVDETPAAFEISAPAEVRADEPFQIAIRALDAGGRPDEEWSGTVTLAVDAGSVSPSAVEMRAGEVVAEVRISGHAGSVALEARKGGVRSDPVPVLVLSGEPPARVEIVPGAVLLPGATASDTLLARVYDADGALTDADVVWASSDPSAVEVDGDGVVTAAAIGSALITATADGITSLPTVALVAEPADGVVLVGDEQVVGEPAPVDPAAPFEPGFLYTVRVQGLTLEAGDLVLGTGQTPLAGRVQGIQEAGADEHVLTLEMVPLNTLFQDLRIDERVPLVELDAATGQGTGVDPRRGSMGVDPYGRSVAVDAAAAAPPVARALGDTLVIGPFRCTADAELPLDIDEPTWSVRSGLGLELVYENGLRRLVVTGGLDADAGFRPVYEAVVKGSATCETVPRVFTVPMNGFLSLFFGVQVPVGIGLGLEAELQVAEVGFDVGASVEVDVALGLDCPGGTCTGVQRFDADPEWRFEPVLPDPGEQFRVQLGAEGYVWARPYLGSALARGAASFEFLSAKVGVKQGLDLATVDAQVEDSTYASGFALSLQGNIAPGGGVTAAIEKLNKLLGTDISTDFDLVSFADTLDTSPRGTFTITPAHVAPGDSIELGELATFTVELQPVDYLGIPSVDRVEFLWEREGDDGTVALGPGRPSCVSVAASAGQTRFECETDFLEEHGGEQVFHAFVHTRLFGVPVPIPLEVAEHARAVVEVGGCPEVQSLVLTTQSEVDAAAGTCATSRLQITEAEGTADPITTLEPLRSLRSAGYLEIGPTSVLTDLRGLDSATVTGVAAGNNAALASLDGLGAVGSEIQSFTLYRNPMLASIAAIGPVVSDSLSLGYLSIRENPALTSLAGLERARKVNDLVLVGTGITDMSALAGLQWVRSNIQIEDNPNLTEVRLVLDTLHTYGGNVDIRRNASLTAVELHVDSLGRESANGIRLEDNQALRTARIDIRHGRPELRFNRLPALQTLDVNVSSGVANEYVVIRETGLVRIDRLNITRIQGNRSSYTGTLGVSTNPQLTDISALTGLESVVTTVSVIDNPQLCVPSDWINEVEYGYQKLVYGNKSEGCD